MSTGTRQPLRVGIARFPGVDGAERAFADALDRDPAAGWVHDAAFVEVHTHGRIVVRGSVAGRYVDLDGQGDVIGPPTGIGAVVGGASGLPLGPSAVAVGLVGGAIAGGAEASRDAQPADPAFGAIRELVPPGSSAVVVVSTSEEVGAMSEALAGVAESFKDCPLSPAAEAQLHSELAAAPPSVRAKRTTSR
jgi:hypothetical protein